MMNIVTRQVATEDAITDLYPQTQELFDKSETQPQYSPAEILAIYPNLEKDANRQALLRVANLSKTPRGKHIAKVLNFVNAMRTSLDYFDAWDRLRFVFPSSDSKEKRHFLVDILIYWCFPCKVISQTIEELKEYSSVDYDYEREILDKGANVSNSFLDIKGKQYISQVSQLEKDLEQKFSVTKDNELSALNDALTTIEIIQRIREGEYYSVWGVIQKSGREITAEDIAARLIEYFRVYYKKQK